MYIKTRTILVGISALLVSAQMNPRERRSKDSAPKNKTKRKSHARSDTSPFLLRLRIWNIGTNLLQKALF
jgi:hypothetical protein